MAKKKQILYPVVFMLVLTVVYTFILAFIYESSFDTIKEQEALRIKRSVLYVLDLKVDSVDVVDASDEAVKTLFGEKIEEKVLDDRNTYILSENGVVSGYAFSFQGTGLWGTISGYIAFSPDFSSVLGIDFVSHSETPGLGGRIDEIWYKEQFRNLPVNEAATVVYRPAEGGTLDGITGATLTTSSVSKMVNAFIQEIRIFAKEANL